MPVSAGMSRLLESTDFWDFGGHSEGVWRFFGQPFAGRSACGRLGSFGARASGWAVCATSNEGRGRPSPVAGRSLRPSRPSLTACPLRFAIHGFACFHSPALRARAAPPGDVDCGAAGMRRSHHGTAPHTTARRRLRSGVAPFRVLPEKDVAPRTECCSGRRPHAAIHPRSVTTAGWMPAGEAWGSRSCPSPRSSCRGHGWPGSVKPGPPEPRRRTFATALPAFAHCMSAALRHPWLRLLP
jgi:hypothetical protein